MAVHWFLNIFACAFIVDAPWSIDKKKLVDLYPHDEP
jgi:hypothetical protein